MPFSPRALDCDASSRPTDTTRSSACFEAALASVQDLMPTDPPNLSHDFLKKHTCAPFLSIDEQQTSSESQALQCVHLPL